jgi:hypothetical protein
VVASRARLNPYCCPAAVVAVQIVIVVMIVDADGRRVVIMVVAV